MISWWLREAEPLASLTELRGPLRADVCIVGGGFTGLWTALEIKRHEPSLDVVLVEADVCGSGASGRNGGFAMTFWHRFTGLERACGADHALWLARASEAAVAEIGEFCDQNEIQAHYRRAGWLWTATNQAQVGAWESTVAAIERHGEKPFERLDADEVAARTGSRTHLAGVFEPYRTTEDGRIAFGKGGGRLAYGPRIGGFSPRSIGRWRDWRRRDWCRSTDSRGSSALTGGVLNRKIGRRPWANRDRRSIVHTLPGIGLADVQAVYDGAEGDLWELVMGEQIHIGGLSSSMELADRAGIAEGNQGVDLCCCNGAGMRFLVRFRKVARMTGVDATERIVDRGRRRTAEEDLSDSVEFVVADATDTGLPDARFDFAWGEDAWCYVENKARLIGEATRLVRPGGTIAFTDWVTGHEEMSDDEAERYLRFMKFPNVLSIEDYQGLLEERGCQVETAEDTGRFPSHVDLYLDMLNKQLTYDALKLIGFDMELMQSLGGEMVFVQELAHANKICQGRFVATTG
jgi:ubiquinone/menaquinone biosynthesis C-methylase UbiE